MRKLIFTLALVMLSIMTLTAQITITVSGYVTSSGTNLAVANHAVQIFAMDSSASPAFFYQNSTNTNTNGFYSFTITGFPSNGVANMQVGTYDCQNQFQALYNLAAPYTANFSICTVAPPCTASFNTYQDSVNTKKFYFTNTSTGNPTSYSWNFGDNTTSTSQNPVHTYANVGAYMVTLSISGNGCQSVSYDTVYASTNTACQANFSSNASTSNPLIISFTNLSTSGMTSFSWNFGDGGTSTQQNPTHVYAAGGTYNVTLTAGNTSCSSTYTSTITVTNPTSGCQSAFQTYQDSMNPYLFYFSNLSTGNPTSYLWNFGDNTTSTLQNPTHTYNSPGYHMVSLTISGNGCQSVSYDTIYAGTALPCQASFTYQATGNTVQFYNTSTGNPTSYLWSFGDGTSSSLMNPSHAFAQGGTYTITLTIFGSSCQNSTTQTLVLSSTTTYSLAGYVTAGGIAVNQGSVILFDQLGNLINTVSLDSSGHYYFGNLAAGNYITYALPLPNSSFAYGYMPTYHLNSISWTTATLINLNTNYWNKNISLVAVTPNNGGNGSVSGNIIQGAKSSVENLNINLLDASNQPVKNTKTDLNGHYSFGNLAYGEYRITVEVAGKTSDVITVSLTQENPVSGSNNFQSGTNSYTVATSIEEAKTSISKLYPNPTHNLLHIELNSTVNENITISIYNNLGVLIKSNQVHTNTGLNSMLVDMTEMPKGIYTLKINSDAEQIISKMIIKL